MRERDLSCFTELAISIADLNGNYLSCSQLNAARLGRPIAGIIGHNWREWIPPADLATAEQRFARAAVGPVDYGRASAIRPDGRIVTSRLTLVPTTLDRGRPGIFQLHSTIFVPTRSTWHAGDEIPRLNVESYVRELTGELVRMANEAGLVELSASLEGVAGAAVEAAARND